jgi:transcription elongation factor GreA-like protein
MPVLPAALSLETVGDAEVQYYQLDYTKFIPHLIGAVKELWTKVLALIESDEAQNARIRHLDWKRKSLHSKPLNR